MSNIFKSNSRFSILIDDIPTNNNKNDKHNNKKNTKKNIDKINIDKINSFKNNTIENSFNHSFNNSKFREKIHNIKFDEKESHRYKEPTKEFENIKKKELIIESLKIENFPHLVFRRIIRLLKFYY